MNALQEAPNFYQSIVSTFPDEVFARMTKYLKEHFQVSEPAVVRKSIRQIREHLGQQSLWEREVIRLEESLIRRCQEHSDIPIYVSIEEWAENLVADARQYFEEEYTMAFEVGAKVKKVRGLNEIFDEKTIVRYGVVRANETAYIVNRDPFDESTMHDYKKYRPKQEDFESAESYASAVREYDNKEIARQAQIVANAEMLLVSWHDCNGNKVAESWEPVNRLLAYTEADTEVDASLSLVHLRESSNCKVES